MTPRPGRLTIAKVLRGVAGSAAPVLPALHVGLGVPAPPASPLRTNSDIDLRGKCSCIANDLLRFDLAGQMPARNAGNPRHNSKALEIGRAHV